MILYIQNTLIDIFKKILKLLKFVNMKTLKEIKKIKSYKNLENLNIGKIICDVGYNGGNLGFQREDISKYFEIDIDDLPEKFGAYCNYLGGGLRGSICASTFSDRIKGRKVELLIEFGKACIRVYKTIENETGLNKDYNK